MTVAMPSLPVVALAIYLATLFLPADVSQFQAEIEGHEVTWTRNEEGFWTPNVPNSLGPTAYKVEGGKVIAKLPEAQPTTYAMSQYLKLPEKPDWKTLKTMELADPSFGSAIQIRRMDEQVTFSQSSGPFAQNPIIISWGDPEQE